MSLPIKNRQEWIRPDKAYSTRRQCRLAGIDRNFIYYKKAPESELNVKLKGLINGRYERHPEYGSPRMTDWVRDEGYDVNHKRITRLMKDMRLQAITPGPHTSTARKEDEKYPYMLRDKEINENNQVWSTDITYIRMNEGWMYLTAVIDWNSRYILSWKLSNTLDNTFCIEVVEEAIARHGKPEIFNTDQGSQYTSIKFIELLKENEIQISMDGKGRALDNVFIERFWWTVKYENIHPNNYEDVTSLTEGLRRYILYYNTERKHSSLDKKTPMEIFNN